MNRRFRRRKVAAISAIFPLALYLLFSPLIWPITRLPGTLAVRITQGPAQHSAKHRSRTHRLRYFRYISSLRQRTGYRRAVKCLIGGQWMFQEKNGFQAAAEARRERHHIILRSAHRELAEV